jgi:hypothetical protein
MSFFPISTNVPLSAMHLHDSSSISLEREFKMTSTPLPFVALINLEENAVDRELKICSGEIPNVLIRNRFFSSVPTVAYI